MKNITIILAAGKSTRCGFDKLLTTKFGISPLEKTLTKFQNCKDIDEIILVSDIKINLWKNFSKISKILKGGKERFFSLKNAIDFLKDRKNSRIIVHNGANPNISEMEISKGIQFTKRKKNIIFGFFTPNSIKKVQNGKVIDYLNREEIFETQTPQISDLKTFQKAISYVETNNNAPIPNDEAELLNLINEKIHIYKCSPENQKITFAKDFQSSMFHETSLQKFGFGEDSHKFLQDFDLQKPFRLGGIDVSEKKLSSNGNSDGDVILHALCNALLSAFGDKTFDFIAKPICKFGEKKSTAYLKETIKYIEKKCRKIFFQQVLISLEGSQPKIAPYHDKIQKNLSKLLGINLKNIGITYTTGENLTSFGRGEGMKCQIFLIVKK